VVSASKESTASRSNSPAESSPLSRSRRSSHL